MTIRLIFLKIGEIDTVKETFAADVFIQAKWAEPSLKCKEGSTVDWDQYWSPKLYVENLLGEGREEIWHSVQFDDHHNATVVQRRRVKGTFLENMELGQFPFDCQVSFHTPLVNCQHTYMQLI